MRTRTAFCLMLSLASFGFHAQIALGSGFAVYTHDAQALGKGNAAVADHDNPSVLYFNPALMTKLSGTQIEVGTTAVFPSREFQSFQTGATTDGESMVYFPSTFYLTHAFNENISAGLGVFNPFGLGTQWDEDWEGRYIATKSEMTTFNINPAIAYSPWAGLSLAFGVDFLYLDASLQNKINLTGVTGGIYGSLPDANQKFEGDGTGVGFNIGAAWDVTPNISVGAHYRSEINVDVKGDTKFSIPQQIPSPLLENLQGTFQKQGAKTEITLPQQLMLGIAYRFDFPLVLEVGARWEGWSSYEELRIELDDGMVAVTPKKWDDVWAYQVGGKYWLNENIALLAGYLYSENPVPSDTFEPAIPDSDSHLFTVGTDIEKDAWKFALAYAYQLHEDRDKKNAIGLLEGGAAANGEYSNQIHMLSASVTYRF